MASYYNGTLVASPIVRGSSGDTFGTHHSTLGIGGYMEVNDISERNAIPVDSVNGIAYDGISSGQRRIGMLVYVHADDTIYKLNISKSSWSGLTNNSKILALANNSNWGVFVGSDNQSTGERLVKQFEQITHGFVLGDVIGFDGTEFTKVSSITAANVEPLGIVTSVVDSNNFKLTFIGYISTSGINDVNSNTISGGTVYYISSTAGKLTPTKPTATNEISKPMLVGMSGNTGMVLQYRGLYETTTSGGTVNLTDFTGYTATTNIYLEKTVTGATNIGYFSGTTGVQTLPINHLTLNDYDGSYRSVYNYYYRDSDGFIRIGTPSDGIPKRAYVRETPTAKSWIWNEYTGQSNPVGWIFVNANVTSDDVYGTKITGSSNIAYSTPVYTVSAWTESQFYNNGSQIVINNVIGNFNTGTTFVETGPIYKTKEDKDFKLRTIKSITPENIKVQYDDYFIKVSGATSILDNSNIGVDGAGVFAGKTGTTAYFKRLVGDGTTSITDEGDRIVISSVVSGTSSGGGENVTKQITLNSHGFSVGNAIGWSGGTYNKAIANGTYGGEIIGLVSKVINSNTFELTQSGFITGLTTLTNNETYYVSTSVAGNLTTTKPSTIGHYVRPILATNSTTSGWVLPYDGNIVTSADTNIILYTGKTPSTVEVGGMVVGTTLTGRTVQSLLEEILVPTVDPILTAPSSTFSISPTTSTYEVGVETDLDFQATFDRGSIYLGATFQDYRSGYPDTYNYTGDGLPSSVSNSGFTDNQSVTGYTVSAGTQSWTSTVTYEEGPQPLDSDGNNFGSPLPSGTTSVKTININGIYPYFWGISASGGAAPGDNRPTADNDLVTGGTKVVSDSDSTITINFNSTSDDYIWFAIPSTSTLKTQWYINALNNGDIGGAVTPGGNLFPDPDSVSVTTVLWSGISYNVYISNYQTSVSTNMELRN